MTRDEVIRELLQTLPKCYACEKPRTRYFVSTRVAWPVTFASQRGVSWQSRLNTAAGAPAIWGGHNTRTYDGTWTYGTWTYDCCDDHTLPSHLQVLGEWDYQYARAVRWALALEGAETWSS